MLISIVIIIAVTKLCEGHGWMKDPPSRSSMWKYGFPTTPNYNHMSLFCGGFYAQKVINKGKCGICGDRFDGPLNNEAGGRYVLGIISRRYHEGQIMNVQVHISAQHFGYFEFRVCPNNNPNTKASQECLDKYLLHQPNGSQRYELHGLAQTYTISLLLPMGLTCSQCVCQWSWHTGLTREEYRNCADIAISPAPYRLNTSLPLDN